MAKAEPCPIPPTKDNYIVDAYENYGNALTGMSRTACEGENMVVFIGELRQREALPSGLVVQFGEGGGGGIRQGIRIVLAEA